jgi:CBS domain-containing protein
MTRGQPLRHARAALTYTAPTFVASQLPLGVRTETPIWAVMGDGDDSVDPAMSVESLATLLLERGLSAVPVIERGALVGMVSMTDLVREVQDRGDDGERVPLRVRDTIGMIQAELGDGFHATELARATVDEIMTPVVFSLNDTSSVRQAAALMAFERVRQLAVYGASGTIVGVVSALDIMRWLAGESSFLRPPPPAPDEPDEPDEQDDRPRSRAASALAHTLPLGSTGVLDENFLGLEEPDRYFDETYEHDGWSQIRLRTEVPPVSERSDVPENGGGARHSHTRLVARSSGDA